MFFKTFVLSLLNSLRLAKSDVEKALRISYAEPLPIKVLISYDNPVNKQRENKTLIPNRYNGNLYEISLPDLKLYKDVHLSFSLAAPNKPLMMDLLVPPNIASHKQDNLINNSINFVLENIVGGQKIFIINKPIFEIENENKKDEIEINLIHYEGNQKINNEFKYNDPKGLIKKIKIINKLDHLNTEEQTKAFLLEILLQKDFKIRQKNAGVIHGRLQKAFAALENIKIRNLLQKNFLETQIKPVCVCEGCLDEKEIENIKVEKSHENKCVFNICPISKIGCFKYNLFTAVNCFDILQILSFDSSLHQNFLNMDIPNRKKINRLLELIGKGENIFEIRVFIQLIISKMYDDFYYRNVNITYDAFMTKILHGKYNQEQTGDAKAIEKEDDEEEAEDEEGAEDENKKKSKTKSRVVLWSLLAISGVAVIGAASYFLMM